METSLIYHAHNAQYVIVDSSSGGRYKSSDWSFAVEEL